MGGRKLQLCRRRRLQQLEHRPEHDFGRGNVPTVANLYQFTKTGNLLLIGQYYNTYRVNVTNP